jgi:hypothetical protein
MIDMVEIPGFCGGAFELPSKNIDAQRCLNLIPERTESGNAKAPIVLLNSPGFEVLVNAYEFVGGSSVDLIRGLYVTSDNRMIMVGDDEVFVFPDFDDLSTAAIVGYLDKTGEQGYGPVTIVDNGQILFIQSWGNIYTWDLPTLGGLAAPTWLTDGFTHIVFQTSFLIINSTLSGGERQMYSSPQDWNGTDAWNILDTVTMSTTPDPIIGIIGLGKDTWVFSKSRYEIWYYSGTLNFPFEPNVSLAYNIGLAAPYSLAITQNSLFWLGSGSDGFGKVYMNEAYQAKRISTNGLEAEIKSYSTITDARGETYQDIGHAYYCLTFPSASKTWVYDLSTGLWHERASFEINGYALKQWRVQGTVNFGNRIVGFDNSQEACIVEVKNDVYTEPIPASETVTQILRLRSCPHIYSGLNRVFYSRFQVDMETGVGISSTEESPDYDDTQGYDPQMKMRYSNDGGYTWSNFLLGGIGKIGERLKRVIWNRLGSARDRVFEISISEPVPIRIMGGWISFKKGTN